MKKLLKMKKSILILLLFVTHLVAAQGEFYVGLHYIKVKSEHVREFIEAEKNYFSKIHKSRIDSGDKIAWDMWKLQNNKMDNSETIFVFAHLQDINKPTRMGNPDKMFSVHHAYDLTHKLNLPHEQYRGRQPLHYVFLLIHFEYFVCY